MRNVLANYINKSGIIRISFSTRLYFSNSWFQSELEFWKFWSWSFPEFSSNFPDWSCNEFIKCVFDEFCNYESTKCRNTKSWSSFAAKQLLLTEVKNYLVFNLKKFPMNWSLVRSAIWTWKIWLTAAKFRRDFEKS